MKCADIYWCIDIELVPNQIFQANDHQSRLTHIANIGLRSEMWGGDKRFRTAPMCWGCAMAISALGSRYGLRNLLFLAACSSRPACTLLGVGCFLAPARSPNLGMDVGLRVCGCYSPFVLLRWCRFSFLSVFAVSVSVLFFLGDWWSFAWNIWFGTSSMSMHQYISAHFIHVVHVACEGSSC